MSDSINNKVDKLNGVVTNGNESPVTPSKLLLNHGKPNYTINRNNNQNSEHYNNNANNVDIIVKSTKFYGALSKTNTNVKNLNNDNNNNNNKNGKIEVNKNEDDVDSIGAKVVLRRTQQINDFKKSNQENENVPEFILRQRAIQQRLAKENVLDFENRRSGYFTHVMITPTSPNRTSFVETMTSPAVVPSLEIPNPMITPSSTSTPTPSPSPPPTAPSAIMEEKSADIQSNGLNTISEEKTPYNETKDSIEPEEKSADIQSNGLNTISEEKVLHTETKNSDEPAEEEVASAIEEVNKAIANEVDFEEPQTFKVTVNGLHSEPEKSKEPVEEVEKVTENEEVAEKTEKIDENNNEGHDITISHAKGEIKDVPHIPNPDPSGSLGVNFEPKTVVSFSKDLGAENKYPDTVQIVSESSTVTKSSPEEDSELAAMTKLKFDIKSDEKDIQVIPVVITE